MNKKLVVGLVLFVGLPLVSWGIRDVAELFSHPARLAYLVAIAMIQAVAAARFPESMDNGRDGEKLVGRQRLVVRWLQLVTVALMVGGPFCDRRAIGVFDVEALRYVGLALAVPGFALMLWARVALGKQFSLQVTIQREHRLVTEGLFRHVRHPRYTGILLFLGGTALLYRSGIGLALFAASVAVLLWRIHDEEALMQQQFGAEWDAYCRKTPRLIPLVY